MKEWLEYSIVNGILTWHEDGVIPLEVINDPKSTFGSVVKGSAHHREMLEKK